MSDTDRPDPMLAAITERHASAAVPSGPTPKPSKREKDPDSFTLSLTVDQDFRRRIRLLAARDNLSLVALIRAAVDLYERKNGTSKDI